MAMVTRSSRNTASDWQQHSTPSVVGPGSYAPKKLSISNKVGPPNFAGFSSSDARRLNANETTSASTPGPGAYVSMKRAAARKGVSQNAFRSGSKRLSEESAAAAARGSSSETPGPGSYTMPDSFQLKASSAAPSSTAAAGPQARTHHHHHHHHHHQRPAPGSRSNRATELSRPGFNPPTIPRQDQANGYYDDETGRPRPLPLQREVFTGRGNDTVSPWHYTLPPTLRNDGTSFALSGTTRTLFQAATAPGPGDYDLDRTGRKDARSAEGMAAFKSRVPMAFEMSAARSDLGYIIGPVVTEEVESVKNGASTTTKVQCFGATSKRQGWNRPSHLPYADPSNTSTPGPGTYAAPPSSFRVQLQKRLTDEPIAFNSSDVRPCALSAGAPPPPSGDHDTAVNNYYSYGTVGPNHRVPPPRGSSTAPAGPAMTGATRSHPLRSGGGGGGALATAASGGPSSLVYTPGPGDYETEHHGVVASIQKRTFGRHGIFGSCSARFTRAGLSPELGAAETRQYEVVRQAQLAAARGAASQLPQPPPSGSRDIPAWKLQQQETEAGQQHPPGGAVMMRRKHQYPFRSTVDRFAGADADPRTAPPTGSGAQVGGGGGAPPLAAYTLPSDFDLPRHPLPSSAMASTTKRFDTNTLFAGVKVSDGPGPGYYKPKPAYALGNRTSKPYAEGAAVKMSHEPRFKSHAQTADDVGPGAYGPGLSLIKKTFNVTYTDGHPGSRRMNHRHST